MWRFLRNRRLILRFHTIFRALVYWAHRAVIFAIAWFSCSFGGQQWRVAKKLYGAKKRSAKNNTNLSVVPSYTFVVVSFSHKTHHKKRVEEREFFYRAIRDATCRLSGCKFNRYRDRMTGLTAVHLSVHRSLCIKGSNTRALLQLSSRVLYIITIRLRWRWIMRTVLRVIRALVWVKCDVTGSFQYMYMSHFDRQFSAVWVCRQRPTRNACCGRETAQVGPLHVHSRTSSTCLICELSSSLVHLRRVKQS